MRRLQEEYHAKGKNCMCFVDLDKVIDIAAKKMIEWAMRKKGIPEVLVKSVMSLYYGAKARVRVDSWMPDLFEGKVWMHQGSVLSCFPFAIVTDIVAELA